MSKTLIHTLGNQNSPAPGSPVTVLSSRTAFPHSSTKLVPLKRRRSSLENDATTHRTSKTDYFVASTTVVSASAAREPSFENVLQGLKYSINDSCRVLFQPTGFAGPAPSIACSDPSRSEYPLNASNRRPHMEQPSEWPFIPSLPSFLRPLPPLDSIGALEPLPPLLDSSILKPLPPVAGIDREGCRLDQLRFQPSRYSPVPSDAPTALQVVETPLVRLLMKMQEYNQEVLESKDTAVLAKSVKKQLDRELKQAAPSESWVPKLGGDGRLNAEKPWNWRNSKLKKGTRKVERRMLASKFFSKAAQFAIRKGKWRRNMLRRLKRHIPLQTSLLADGSHVEIRERTTHPLLSTGSSPMSICSVLDFPSTLAVEIPLDLLHAQTPEPARSPSNDAFSISSTPPIVASDLPSEDYPPKRPKLPDFQTAIEDAWKAVIARGDYSENRSKSPDFQAAFDNAWKTVMATGVSLEARPKSPDFRGAFEDAWEAVMANGVDLGSPPQQRCSPPRSCSPIPGLSPASWSSPPDEEATNQGEPSWATLLKRKVPPSPTWSPPANDAWSLPIDGDSNQLDLDAGISLKEPTPVSAVVPISRQDRATPGLRLLLSPEPTLHRPLYNRYSENSALPTPIDEDEQQLPPITPLDLLEPPSKPHDASDTNSLFDGDLSDTDESVAAETRTLQEWRPRTPSPISTRDITFTRTPESRQLPTPSSLSPQPLHRLPIRLPSIRSIFPMHLSTEVRNKLHELEAEAQEPSTVSNLLKTQLWREQKAGKNGALGGRTRLDRGPVLPIPAAALEAIVTNAFAALRLREFMTKKDDEAMAL